MDPEFLVSLSIGLGLVVSFFYSETLGIAAGGMVVPGYIALYLDQPLYVMLTLLTSIAVYLIVRLLSQHIIIYGRRRTMMTILLGFSMGGIVHWLVNNQIDPGPLDLGIIGYIIPGLIAIWHDRQGAIETTASLLSASIFVRLLLILALTGESAL